ncbi:hypothetical protein MJ524_08435 [Escherichia coli]|nr:hypothetical protein MJ524_08435 [Escherichia coli]
MRAGVGLLPASRAWSIRWAGINTLWPLFGIANQMLAGMALMLCAVVLFKMKRQRYAWVALVPNGWLLICTLTAGWQKAFVADCEVGFLAIANKFQAMIDSGNIPSQYTESQLAQLVFNNRLDAGLTIFFSGGRGGSGTVLD